MTNTKSAPDPVAEIFAKLDAQEQSTAPAPAPLPAPDLAAAMADAEGQALMDAIHQRKGQEPQRLAAAALAGITSGRARVERNRPGRGKHRQLAVPITSQGMLAAALGELTAGHSRRYAQDVEGWCRAALADGAGRGVLVVWDGIDYSIQLHRGVPRATVLELRRADYRAWLDSVS